MIKFERYENISEKDKEKLSGLIDDEFGDIPIVSQIKWASPDWTIFSEKNDELVSFYNIVLRDVAFDQSEFKIAGISNVITPNKHRKNGYASKMLTDSEAFIFNEISANYGLLLCADPMVPFYERLGWYLVESDVYFNQSGGKQLWESNARILSDSANIYPEVIDLNGLPW